MLPKKSNYKDNDARLGTYFFVLLIKDNDRI